MMQLQYRENLFSTAIRVGGVYEKAVVNDVSINMTDVYTRHCLQKYWAPHCQLDRIGFFFALRFLTAPQTSSS